jgi:hypothetical protein
MFKRTYSVRLANPEALPTQAGKRIIFHGVNKSGSRALSDVVRRSLAAAGREHEYHSHYDMRGTRILDFLKLIRTRPPPAFFVGHYLFGRVDLADPNNVLITQFRHPLPRLLSCYHWRKANYARQHGSDAGFPDFSRFVVEGGGRANSQIFQFAAGFGRNMMPVWRTFTAQQMLEAAMENIERHVAFFGIAEHFEETIFLTAHLCGVPRVHPWKKDVRNAGRPLASTLPQATIDLVEETYRCEYEFYAWAKRRFLDVVGRAGLRGDIEGYRAACAGEYKDRLLGVRD